MLENRITISIFSKDTVIVKLKEDTEKNTMAKKAVFHNSDMGNTYHGLLLSLTPSLPTLVYHIHYCKDAYSKYLQQ